MHTYSTNDKLTTSLHVKKAIKSTYQALSSSQPHSNKNSPDSTNPHKLPHFANERIDHFYQERMQKNWHGRHIMRGKPERP